MRSSNKVLTVACLTSICLSMACGGAEPTPQVPAMPVAEVTPPPAPAAPVSPVVPAAPVAVEVPAAPATKKNLPVITIKDVGFATPESVLHDADGDVYLVSNINGAPGAVDGNGFISKVGPDGKVLQLKWIEGGKNGVKLDAPKGMAIVGDVLYVSDITTVRMFDRKTGKANGEVKLAGATFLNDLTSRGGKVYASDSGIKISDKGVEATKSDAVWMIEKGKAKSMAKGEMLGKPNGLLATDKGVWVVTFGTGELYRLDDKGAKVDSQKLPKGSLDGIAAVGGSGDSVLISSWEASAVYRGSAGGTFEAILTDIKAPADLGVDSKRSRVMVPLFNDNAVEIYELK